MYLKKLKIKGFKSFVQETEVIFSKTISAIVGPNGCGKSNLLDALRWVVGESSSSKIRAQTSSDILFNGNNKRDASNQCYVELQFINVALKGIYKGISEVAIKRSYQRNEGSKYFINGKICRRRDVLEFFNGTGIGNINYALIEQGSIARIVDAKPSELRLFLEEAAGIGLYRVKKVQTLAKLDNAQQNLEQLRILNTNIVEQLSKLQSQLDAAEQYAKLSKQIQQLEIQKYKMDYQTTNNDITNLRDKIKINTKKLNTCLANYEKEQSKLKIIKQKLIDLEQQKDEVQTNYHNKDKLFATKQQQIIDKQQRVEEWRERYNHIKSSLNLTKSNISALECEIQKEENPLLELKQKQSNLKQQLESLVSIKNEQQNDFNKVEQEFSVIKNQHDKTMEEISLKQYGLDLKQKMLDSEKKTHADILRKIAEIMQSVGIEQTVNTADFNHQELNQQVVEFSKRMKTICNQADITKKQLMAKRNELIEQNSKVQKAEQNLEEHKKIEQNIKTQIETIHSRLPRNVIEFLSSKRVQQNTQHNSFSLIQMASLLRQKNPKSKFAEPISNFIAQFLYAYVLLQKQELNYSELLLGKDIYRFNTVNTNLPTNIEIIADLDNCTNLLDLLEIDTNNLGEFGLSKQDQTELRKQLVAYFGKVYLIPNLEKVLKQEHASKKAYKIILQTSVESGLIFITQDSYLINTTRISKLDANQDFTNINYANSLQKQLQEQVKLITSKQLEVNKLINTRQQSEEQLKYFEQENEPIYQQISQIKYQQQIIRDLQDSLFISNTKVEDLQNDIQSLRQELSYQKNINRKQKEQVQQLQEKRKELQQQNQYFENFNKLNNLYNSVEHELQQRQRNQQVKQLQLDNLNINLKKDESEKQILKQQISNTKEFTDKSLQEITKELKQLSTTLEKQIKQISIGKLDSEQQQKKLDELKENNFKLEQNLRNKQEKLANLEIKQHEIINKATEKNISKEELLQQKIYQERDIYNLQNLSLPETKQQIVIKIRQREALGFVNMKAVEEYQEIKIKHDELSEQIADVEMSCNNLYTTIQELDETSATKLLEVYEKVNQQYKILFPKLFNGGKGKLQWNFQILEIEQDKNVGLHKLSNKTIIENKQNNTKSKDYLQAGIDIIGKPKGKNNTKIKMLSGGEKTLTALAFIYAIFSLSPAPFCVLDEVDAPLDDANILRFASLVNSFTNQVQLILITHNKITMESAKNLIGVTMNEPGVSRVVGVDMQEAEKFIK